MHSHRRSTAATPIALLASVALSLLTPVYALAAPSLATCSANTESHTGVVGACPSSWCTFDPGTGLLGCDMDAFCAGAGGGALAAVTNPLVGAASYDWVATVECNNTTTSCCTIDDPAEDITGFRMKGSSNPEAVGFAFCDNGWSGDTCTGTVYELTSTRATRLLTTELNAGGGDDDVWGTSDARIEEVLRGNGGADALFSRGSKDSLYGGAGNDFLSGGAGNDGVYGEAGIDECIGGDGDDVLDGGDEDDTSLNGQAGDDIVKGGNGEDMVIGGDDNDTLIGGNGFDVLEGEAGDDTLCEDGTDGDLLKGGDNDDILWYDPAGGVAVDSASLADPTADLYFDYCSSAFSPASSFFCNAVQATKPTTCP